MGLDPLDRMRNYTVIFLEILKKLTKMLCNLAALPTDVRIRKHAIMA